MKETELKEFLDLKYGQYHNRAFIDDDPILIPHMFDRKEDIEISGFFSALIAWGRRSMIIRNAKHLMELMDFQPYEFVLSASGNDLNRIQQFVHRTFQGEDCLALVLALRKLYQDDQGLEGAFCNGFSPSEPNIRSAIISAREAITDDPQFPSRTHKHLANPLKGSSAKRINMYLRWMVRSSKGGVDFGLWKHIRPSQLICPLDVHTASVARKLGILQRKSNDWKAAVELTATLSRFCPEDPVRYDFSLFGLGVYENFSKNFS